MHKVLTEIRIADTLMYDHMTSLYYTPAIIQTFLLIFSFLLSLLLNFHSGSSPMTFRTLCQNGE